MFKSNKTYINLKTNSIFTPISIQSTHKMIWLGNNGPFGSIFLFFLFFVRIWDGFFLESGKFIFANYIIKIIFHFFFTVFITITIVTAFSIFWTEVLVVIIFILIITKNDTNSGLNWYSSSSWPTNSDSIIYFFVPFITLMLTSFDFLIKIIRIKIIQLYWLISISIQLSHFDSCIFEILN